MKVVIANHSASKCLALPLPFQCRLSPVLALMTPGLLGENLDRRRNTHFRMTGRKARNPLCVVAIASHPPCAAIFFLSVHFIAVHCLNPHRKDTFRAFFPASPTPTVSPVLVTPLAD